MFNNFVSKCNLSLSQMFKREHLKMNCGFYALLIVLILNIKLEVCGLEIYPSSEGKDRRDVCPGDRTVKCETDEDCRKQIGESSLDENCSKCVCWNVPVCNVKKLEYLLI